MDTIIKNLVIVSASTLFIYFYLGLLFRIGSRRQMSQLTALDLLTILLLGSAVETSMVHGDTSLKAGIVSGTTLFITNYLVSLLIRRSKRIARVCGAGPVLVVHDGKFVEEHLRRYGLTHEDIFQALRQREMNDLSNVRFAVLEPDGEITVIPQLL